MTVWPNRRSRWRCQFRCRGHRASHRARRRMGSGEQRECDTLGASRCHEVGRREVWAIFLRRACLP